ncbi:MAG TPA: Ku protein [Candidatus Saccharimonadales bacterium]|nr:Ku protein [Candidatus Saccharimonadales bacterium]
MRPLWTGSLSFGLISIPVTMYSASKERSLDFAMLRKSDLCPISFKRVCKTSGEEVPYEDIVKGFEYREDKYVVLDEDDFKRASPEKSERIDIEAFVSEEEVNSKYYEKPYYLEPGKGADKAYVLLREALAQEKKVAVARMVFRQREDLVIVKPDENIILLNQLRYPDELRDHSDIKVPHKADLSHKEIGMAIELIEKMTDRFNPKSYHDTYTEKLEEIIKAKARGKKFKPLPKEKNHKQTEPTDLVAQLRASLEHHR